MRTNTPHPAAAIIVAAGQGTRLQAQLPKAWVELSGQTLIERSLRAALNSQEFGLIVLVVAESWLDHATALIDAVSPSHPGCCIVAVAGGTERTDSVLNGLRAVRSRAPFTSIVAIHDAARALTPPALFSATVEAIRAGEVGVVPAMALSDTVKTVDNNGVVTGTPKRASLRAIQTPQAFDLELLWRANEHYEANGDGTATDDASIMEFAGYRVSTIEGNVRAFKITTPTDLAWATWMLEESNSTPTL